MKALDECDKLNLSSTKTRVFNELGATAKKGNNFTKALNYYLKSDSIYNKKGGRMSFQLNVKIAIGECLLALQEIEKTKLVIDEIRPVLGTIVDNKEILARLDNKIPIVTT